MQPDEGKLDDDDVDDEDDVDEESYDGNDYLLGSPQPDRHGPTTVGRNDPCPCGSGKKFKKCCLGKQRQQQAAAAAQRFPIGTVAHYGPDGKRTTKIVASVIVRQGAAPIIERWTGDKVKDDPKVKREIQAFFKRHRVRSVVATSRNLGCPHEEGVDFPHGGDCPHCPFWKGRQGSGAFGARSFSTWDEKR
jgi:hypothetical protein